LQHVPYQYLRSTRSAVDWKPKGWLFFTLYPGMGW
jgi:hypothetical protein